MGYGPMKEQDMPIAPHRVEPVHDGECPYCDYVCHVRRESKAARMVFRHVQRKHPDL